MKQSTILLIFIGLATILIGQNSLTNNDINFQEASYNSSYILDDEHAVVISATSALSSNVQETGRVHFLGYGMWNKMGLAMGVKLNSRFREFHRTTSTEFLLAKQIMLDKKHYLNFGLNFGILHTGLNEGQLNSLVDLSDAALINGNRNLSFQSGFGISYVFNDALKFGFSMPEVAKSSSAFYPTIFSNISYKMDVANNNMYIEPSALLYLTDIVPPSVQVAVNVGYRDYGYIKVGGRSTKSILFGLGAGYDFIEFGYTGNMNFGDYQDLNNMQHNINVQFTLLDKRQLAKKEIKRKDDDFYKEPKKRNQKSAAKDEKSEDFITRAKLIGHTGALYYVAMESYKERNEALKKQSELKKEKITAFVMKDKNAKVYYICLDSDNNKKSIIEKYEILKNGTAPNAWIIINE